MGLFKPNTFLGRRQANRGNMETQASSYEYLRQQRQQQQQRYNNNNSNVSNNNNNINPTGNPNNHPGNVGGNFQNIGQDEEEAFPDFEKLPRNKKESTFWKSFFLYGSIILFLISLFVLSLLAAIFSGMANDKDCPDCVCTTPITSGMSQEDVFEKLNEKDESATMLMDALLDDESLKRCVKQCYTNFIICPYGDVNDGTNNYDNSNTNTHGNIPDNEGMEKCKEKTNIARGCTDFVTCVSECKGDCPFRSKDNLYGNVCLNKFNYDLLCP